jgi:hypothetical protein
VKSTSVSCSAFAPDGSVLWVADESDRRLQCFKAPKLESVSQFRSKSAFSSLGVDREGRLYGQTFSSLDSSRRRLLPRAGQYVGDIQVWENLEPNGGVVNLPAPVRTLPLKGFVTRFANAPDGSWLYFLDSESRMLGRIDPKTGTIDRTIGPMAVGASQFCVTPNGKKIYCCSTERAVDLVDAEKFEFEKEIRTDAMSPIDIAATDKGRVYLVGKGGSGKVIFTMDLGGAPIEAGGFRKAFLAADAGMWVLNVRMLPNQEAMIFSSSAGYSVCGVVDAPNVFDAPISRKYVLTGPPAFHRGGEGSLSPDGKLLITNNGMPLTIE